MKMNIWWIVGGAVVVLGGLGYFLLQPSAPAEESSSSATTTATATTLKKDLSVMPAGKSSAEMIATSAPVAEGDTLATSHEGRGLITMTNGSTAVLDYDSSMVLEGLDTPGTHTRLGLLAGSVWARVEKVFGQGEYFEIRTRNAVAVVRGTSFGVTVHDDGSTTAFVSKGTVALTPLDPATGKLQEYKTVVVSAGNKGMVFANGSTSQSPLKPTDTSSDWFLYNNPTAATPAATTPIAPSSVTAPAAQTVQTTVTQTPPAVSGSPSVTAPTVAADACSSVSETGSYTGAKSSLKLSSVSPVSVSQSYGGTVTLTGAGFTCATVVTVGATTLDGETGFTVVNDSTITFPSAKLLTLGTFDVFITDSLGGTASLTRALTVTR